jgi:hypothetical protein
VPAGLQVLQNVSRRVVTGVGNECGDGLQNTAPDYSFRGRILCPPEVFYNIHRSSYECT